MIWEELAGDDEILPYRLSVPETLRRPQRVAIPTRGIMIQSRKCFRSIYWTKGMKDGIFVA